MLLLSFSLALYSRTNSLSHLSVVEADVSAAERSLVVELIAESDIYFHDT